MLGRLFTADECRKNAGQPCLSSYFFWKRRLAGDPSLVGQTITLNNAPVTVAVCFPHF